jgi:hypothetical protein
MATLQLPQPLACLAQECKGGRETEGRNSRLRKLCYALDWGTFPGFLSVVLEGWGLCPFLPPWGEPLSFSQISQSSSS